jgi:zinc transporter 1/2/3
LSRAKRGSSAEDAVGLAGMAQVAQSAASLEAALALRGGFSAEKLSLSLPVTKVLLQATLTFFNVLCWALPLSSAHFTQNEQLLSLANAFAGGIFLMLSFGHLMPESMAAMVKLRGAGAGAGALLWCLVGWSAMLFVEKVAFATDEGEDADAGADASAIARFKQSAPVNKQQRVDVGGGSGGASKGPGQSAVALCLAMSIHSFFEAAALGLAADLKSAYMMTACIALHQPAESLALLVAFLKSGLPKAEIAVWLSCFSCVAMVGVSAGLAVQRLADSSVEAVVMAITAGTFLYVGATEIASEEFEGVGTVDKVKRFAAYMGGMALMHRIAGISEKLEGH